MGTKLISDFHPLTHSSSKGKRAHVCSSFQYDYSSEVISVGFFFFLFFSFLVATMSHGGHEKKESDTLIQPVRNKMGTDGWEEKK